MRTLLTLLYFAVVTPLGRIGRTPARRARELRLDVEATTYWQPSAPYTAFDDPR